MNLSLESLTELVDQQEKGTFFYKDVDHPNGGDSYRIFSYRLASFKDFQKNSMFEWCRGTMFNLRTGELVCRPMEKFFNYHEWINNGEDLPESTHWNAFIKHDGSLVSTYVHSDGKIYLKSKQSLESEQALKATELFHKCYTPDIIENLIDENITVNFEYVAPDNIIVVPYSEQELLPLNKICNTTGEYKEVFYGKELILHNNLEEFIEDTYNDDSRLHEGYVIMSDDYKTKFKVKTNRYSSAHRLKDDVHSLKKLVEIVANGNIDDVLTCKDLSYDKNFHAYLLDKTETIKDVMNVLIASCEHFYIDNKHLDRKDYAIKAKSSTIPISIAMNYYLERETDYVSFFIKNRKELFEE